MRIIEEHLDIKNVARKVLWYPCDHDVNAAFPQLPMFQCRGIRLKNTNNDLRKSTRQLVDGPWHQPCVRNSGHAIRTSPAVGVARNLISSIACCNSENTNWPSFRNCATQKVGSMSLWS